MPILHVGQLQGPYLTYVLGGTGGLILTLLLLCLNFKRQNKRQRVSLQLPVINCSSVPISHGHTSVSTRSSHGPDDDTIGDATIGSTLIVDSPELEIIVNSVDSSTRNALKLEPDIITTALETDGNDSAYAEVTGLNLDIQVKTSDAEDEVSAMKRGSLRGSINRNSQKGKKKDKRASLPVSTLTPGSDQGDYASVTSMLSNDLPADFTAEGDVVSLRSSRGSVKSQAGRNSQRGKRKASASLPQAPQPPRCAYASVTPGLSTAQSRDAQSPAPMEADDVSLRSRGSVRGSVVSRRDRSSLPAASILPVAPSDYASVTPLSAPKSTDSEVVPEIVDSHYAAVLHVTDESNDPVVHDSLFVSRLHKSHSVGAYAQVDLKLVLNSLEEGGSEEPKVHNQVKRLQTLPYDPTQAQSYARPKKLNLSFDLGEGSTPYAQPAKTPAKGPIVSGPSKDLDGLDQAPSSPTNQGSPEAIVAQNRRSMCSEMVEDTYAVPTQCDTRSSVIVECPYAQPAVPQKTPDALSLLSTDDLMASTSSVSEDDR